MKTYNTAPYFDDFDESKNFHQIMFKPGKAVQARELTQLQSILKNQIARFGSHIFQQGSLVVPGGSRADLASSYIKAEPQINAVDVDFSLFEDQVIVGLTSNVRAIVRKIVAANDNDPNTLYVNYITAGGVDSDQLVFQSGEEVALLSAPTVKMKLLNEAGYEGTGSLALIDAGVYFVDGHFVYVSPQIEVISKYDNVPSCHVLLKITEEIISHTDDTTLLDPASGSYNYAAPGADRLVISLTLTTLPLNDAVTDDYIEIMRFNEGVLEEHATSPKYNELEKSLARRTFDESGDYVVNGFGLLAREHLKTRVNNGVYTTANGGDENKLVYQFEPGKAYVRGFEVSKISSTRLEVAKARTVNNNDTVSFRPQYGSYLLATNIVGVGGAAAAVDIVNRELVNLYDQPSGGTLIGTARIIGIDYEYGSVPTTIVRLIITDLALSGGYTTDHISRFDTISGNIVSGKIVHKLTTDAAVSFTSTEVVSNANDTRTATVVSHDTSLRVLYVTKHTASDIPSVNDVIDGATSLTTGKVTARTSVLTYGADVGLVYPLPFDVTKSLTDKNDLEDNIFKVHYMFALSTDGSGNGSVSAPAGGIIDTPELGTFIAYGDQTTGILNNNLFSVNGPGTTLSIAGGPANATVRVYCSVTLTDKSRRNKTLNENESQLFTTPGSAVLTLNHTDVIEIESITDNDTGADITNNYILDNGQRDYAYLRGRLTLRSTAPVPTGNVTVLYSWYSHSAGGSFFCADSFPSGSNVNLFYSITTGTTYNLNNTVDFRSSVGTDGEFNGAGNSYLPIPVPGTLFRSAVQYYLPRIDVITLNSAGKIGIVAGIPAVKPKEPTIGKELFKLASVFLPAYTFNAQNVRLLYRPVYRKTMHDIANIETRIDRVERYITLSSQETSVMDIDIVNADTGISRLKTGIFVESFSSPLQNANTIDPLFSASFADGCLLPRAETADSLANLRSGHDCKEVNGYLMLDYTEQAVISQPQCSKVNNLNPFLVIRWRGILDLFPSQDNWVEMVDLPTIYNTRTTTVTVNRLTPGADTAVFFNIVSPRSVPPAVVPQSIAFNLVNAPSVDMRQRNGDSRTSRLAGSIERDTNIRQIQSRISDPSISVTDTFSDITQTISPNSLSMVSQSTTNAMRSPLASTDATDVPWWMV